FHLAAEHLGRALAIHNQQDEVRRLATELKADVASFQSKHRWGAPRAGKVLPFAAGDRPSAVATADADGEFLTRREDDHALCPVEQVLGNVLRHVEDFS